MSNAIALASFSFPTVIDVSNGAVDVPFSIVTALAPGVAIDDVTLLMNLSGDTASFKTSGTLVDTFDDATPSIATSNFHFDGLTRAGTYGIDALVIRDKAGHTTTFGSTDLVAKGAPVNYRVTNTAAPAAPTAALAGAGGAGGNTFDRNSATLTGTAAPGSKIAVRAIDDDSAAFTWVDLGSTTTAADGRWTLATPTLDNGSYVLVYATATLGGNTSVNSMPLSFHIAAGAPDAPSLHVHLDGLGRPGSPAPFVSGLTDPGAAITVFDGATPVAHAVAGRDGWYGAATAPLAAGAHSLTAVATDAAGHASVPSRPLGVSVDAHAAPGIAFRIDTMTNTTNVRIDQAAVQGVLDEVGAIVSAAVGGNERIGLTVVVEENAAGNPAAAAAASPGPMTLDPATGMPLVPHGFLYLSAQFANQLVSVPQLARNTVAVLTHEMLHVLAFHSTVQGETHVPQLAVDPFGHLTRFDGATPYFTGYHASAINDGPVRLRDLAHLDDTRDIMYAGTSHDTALTTYFSSANPTAPLTGLDLAILKDCGYAIKDAFASADGHRLVAGDGSPGHDHVTGGAGTDTLFVAGRSDGYTVHGTHQAATLADAGQGVTQHLAGIERIHFADSTRVLDVDAGQTGGAAYRLYQAAFHRTPDADGLGFWVGALDGGASLEGVANGFVASPEFEALYGKNVSDSRFIDLLYLNALGRPSDAQGKAFWVDALEHGTSRAVVLVGFSESVENVTAVGATIGDGFTMTHPH